jgi:hypothetical protein
MINKSKNIFKKQTKSKKRLHHYQKIFRGNFRFQATYEYNICRKKAKVIHSNFIQSKPILGIKLRNIT